MRVKSFRRKYVTTIALLLATTTSAHLTSGNAEQTDLTRQAARPNGGWGAVWSPDGNKIAFLSQGWGEPAHLWALSCETAGRARSSSETSARCLTTSEVQGFNWSTDSQRLLFTTAQSGRVQCGSVSLKGEENARPYPMLPSSAFVVIPSPDGKWLAYATGHAGAAELWLAKSDGSEQVHVTTMWSLSDLSWSSQSNYLAFFGGFSPMSAAWKGQVWVYNLKKKSLARIGQSGTLYPVWSPDGKRLAYSLSAPPSSFGLVISDLENSKGIFVRKAVHTGEGTAWSPDGSLLAITVKEKKGSRIYIVRPTGAVVRKIGNENLMARFPCWSPRGSAIVFEGQKRGRSYASEVWVADAKTGKVKRLTRSYPSDWSPLPSPDGRYVAFRSLRGHRHQIWIARSDGSRERVVADAPAGAQLVWTKDNGSSRSYRDLRLVLADSQNITFITLPPNDGLKGTPRVKTIKIPNGPVYGSPAISPAGDSAVYTSFKDHRPALCVLNLTSLQPSYPFPASKDHAPPDLYPGWSHDGKKIGLLRGDEVWVTTPDGKDAHAVASFKGANPAEGAVKVALSDFSNRKIREAVELSNLSWSPDDKRIAVTATRYFSGKVPPPPQREIWIVECEGGKAWKLDQETLRTVFSANLLSCTNPPTFIASGKVLFTSDRDGKAQIYLADPETNTVSRLHERQATYPAALPNGNYLIASADGEGAKIYVLETATGTVRPWLASSEYRKR